MALKIVTPPIDTPISLVEAKAHCHVDHNDDDAMLGLYIEAATSALDGDEGALQRALMPQTWDLYWDEFPSGPIKIPLPPLISVDQVAYENSSGVWITMAPSTYEVDVKSFHGWVVPAPSWPTDVIESINVVQVRFQCGYTTIPPALKSALLIMVGDMYKNKESVMIGQTVAETSAVKSLLSHYRLQYV